jgi:hypothetical protein
MRRLFRADEVHSTRNALRWAVEMRRIRPVGRGVYAAGGEPVSALDRARADVLRSGREARGHLAGVLHGLDSVWLDGRPTRRDRLPDQLVVVRGGIRCADGLTTLVDLAATLGDPTWEQAMESALRKRLTDVAALEAMGGGRPRIRRVLALRPPGAPATESLLETLMVQLCRGVIGDLVRQHEVRDEFGNLIARLDLSRPTSACSSSWTVSSTRASPSTTPSARQRSWRPPAGCPAGSPGQM